MVLSKIADMKSMEGMTIAEMAKKLSLGIKTVEGRIQRGGYKPLTKDALYALDVFEAIRNVPGKGRPRKAPETPAKAPKKPKK
jgi:hypothetical protein